MAKTMKIAGEPIEKIAAFTGFTIAAIKKIKAGSSTQKEINATFCAYSLIAMPKIISKEIV